MPLGNIVIILVAATISLLCYHRTSRNPYAAVLDEALHQIDARYLERTDQRALFEGAMEGILAKLDPYSAYISPERAEQLQQSLAQHFGGIGIEVTVDPDTKRLAVFSPLPGTPAHEAGIQAGDIIEKIEGEDTAGFKVTDAVHHLRGKPGTQVRLTIRSLGEAATRDVVLTRASIKVDSVLGDVRRSDLSWDFRLAENPRIGYLRIVHFGQETPAEVEAALRIIDEQCQALIIDLRDNPGGLLDETVRICDMFIDHGPIVSTRGRDEGIREKREATPGVKFDRNKAVVVLVNKYSASASEIFAACLQDHGRATIVGQRTWGKGTVQQIIGLEGGKSLLKLTTASYWRPSGTNIHRLKDAPDDAAWGVSPHPDFDIAMSDDVARQVAQRRRERDVIRRRDAAPAASNGTTAPEGPAPDGDPMAPAADKPADTNKGDAATNGDDPQLQAAIEFLEGKLRLWDKEHAIGRG